MSGAAAIDFLLLAAIWGSSFLFMRIAVVDFGPVATAAVRVAIAAAFLLPFVLWRGLLPDLRKHARTVMLIGVVNSGLPFLLFAYSLLAITTGLSGILNATVPLFGALVAWAWLGDRPTGSRVLGLVVGFFGIAMLAWDKAAVRPGASEATALLAILACLLASVLYGIAANATKRYLAGVPSLVAAAGSQVGAMLFLALPAAWTWPAKPPGADAWLAVAAVGVLCTGLAYILYFRLLARVGPARAVAVTFIIPVFAILYGAVFLSEPVTVWMLSWGAVVVLGTALATGMLKLPAWRTLQP
jgi:drug/metabolite transporter (DMT)-like permease